MARLDTLLAYPVRAVAVGPKTTSPGQRNPGAFIGNVRFAVQSGGMPLGVTGMYGVSIARSATGIYTMTYPAAPSGSRLDIRYNVVAGATLMVAYGVSNSQFTGTAQFNVLAGTSVASLGNAAWQAVNPVAGDQFSIDFYLDSASLANTAP